MQIMITDDHGSIQKWEIDKETARGILVYLDQDGGALFSWMDQGDSEVPMEIGEQVAVEMIRAVKIKAGI